MNPRDYPLRGDPIATISHNGNGHRRRELVKRVKAEEHNCALCDAKLDRTLTMDWGKHSKRCDDPECKGCIPHPRRIEIDEDLPRARGGSPYDRRNTHAMHRQCNQYKGAMTIAEAKAKMQGHGESPTTVTASPIW